MVKTIRDVQHARRTYIANQVEGIPAELGQLQDSGSYLVRVPNTTDKVYARLFGDENQVVIAINHKTEYKARLPVRVRKTSSKVYEVISTDPIPAEQFLGEAAPTANTPPLIGELKNFVLTDQNYKPGRVRPHTGEDLTVYIEEFFHGAYACGGITLDLTTEVGALSASMKAPIVISIAPETNTANASTGTEVSSPVPISRQNCADVPIPAGDVRLWAYVFIDGDTTIPITTDQNNPRVFDMREHLGSPTPRANLTEVGNVGAGEDDLITHALPANYLHVNGHALHFVASGIFAATVNAKRIRAKLGATTLFDTGVLAITAAGNWIVEGWIIRESATVQKCAVKFTSSDAALLASADYVGATEDLTTALTLKLTGEATADNDIVQEFMLVERPG